MIADWLASLPWVALVALPLAILAAYTVFGATGFGSSVIAVPLLAHWFPLTFIVPLMAVLDVGAATGASVRLARHAVRAELVRLLPWIIVGIAAGVTLLVQLPRGPALVALAVFITVYGIYVLLARREPRPLARWTSVPIGLAGGVFSVLFGTGGPLYIVYLSGRIADKAALRATSATLIAVSVWLRISVFIVTGLLLDTRLLATAAVLLPAMLVGLALGNRLHTALSGRGVLKLIAVLLVANGITLLLRAH